MKKTIAPMQEEPQHHMRKAATIREE